MRARENWEEEKEKEKKNDKLNKWQRKIIAKYKAHKRIVQNGTKNAI